MKVEMKKATDVTQAVGIGAAVATGGASGLAGASAFATLLSTFTVGDAKQAALQSADFHSSKKSVAAPAATVNSKPSAVTVKESSQKFEKAATKAAAKSETSGADTNTNASAAKPANNESNESNENDADADNAAQPAAKGAAAQAAPHNVQASDQAQQPVKMEDVIKALNLNEQQVQQLAQALNISAAELKQMQIAVTTDAQTGAAQLTALMAGGKEQNLSAMLGMNAATGSAAPAQAVMDKIAGILNLDNTQKQAFFEQLNLSSISSTAAGDAKSASGGTILKNSNAAKQADQSQPSAANATPAIETGKTAVQNAAQSGNNGNGGNSFNGEAGAQIAAAAQKDGAVTEQPQETDFSAALGKAGEAAGAAATQGAKTAAATAAGQTLATETAKPESKVMNQIVEKANILQFPNATQTKISLNPKELGNVDIKLTMHDSSVTASIVVENSAVKQVVEQHLDQLKNALHQQGITVDEMMVSVDQQNGGNAQNPDQSQREAAAYAPATETAQRAPEPAAASPAFMRRPAGNHRVSVTA